MTEKYTPQVFVSPLTDEEHAQLGRIAILWGQADWLIDEIILGALKITREQHKALIGEKPLGPKINLLKPHLKDVNPPEAQEAAKKFVQGLDLTKSKRNSIFHGVWGWRAHPRKQIVERCARHPKSLNDPPKAEDLPALEKALHEAVAEALKAACQIWGFTPPKVVGRFLHGREEEAPEWFQQWQAQRPLTDQNWDHSLSEGQLPRLTDPMK
ncbi:hypothetical protein [uncultured Erythrobacter sp.]|uniref:hypothetical protein n=1 Tax=uncultured Erythrobacter sp. TaxID=263913 RepID=UPI0026354C7A|nr:hypothetical protein [uncultured Erythrobacter sp.]